MESYIQISKINDFLYCPLSIYLHSIYENFNAATYHQHPQVAGKIKHASVENGTYTTANRFIAGMEIWSETYNLVGKIDVYDQQENALVERKTRITHIFDGYKYQLYAQYFCMTEMGYSVKRLFLHSLDDNKRYAIALPDAAEQEKFKNILQEMRVFKIEKFSDHSCPKCIGSIYGALSW